jgi:hypothetical protein
MKMYIFELLDNTKSDTENINILKLAAVRRSTFQVTKLTL